MQSSIIEFLPLLQSLVGALGAFAVASFTVWLSNKHSTKREEKQATRVRTAERQRVLREKLELVLASCDATFSATRASTTHAVNAVTAVRNKQPVPTKPTSADDYFQGISEATVTARLYFPSLAEPVNELFRELRDYSTTIAARASAAAAGDNLAIEEPSAFSKAKALRFAVIDEARRLIANDFDLKDE